MVAPLDELYFQWLYSQVASVRLKNPTRTYWSLLRQFHSKEFVWFVPNDDNRLEDGRDLRHEFLEANRIQDPDPNWLNMGCSMLEMLIGLSRRLSFDGEGEPRVWFWHMLENVKLIEFNDNEHNAVAERIVDETLDRIIFRQYRHNGQGGLFPLKHPQTDQRRVELWYQASAYLGELL